MNHVFCCTECRSERSPLAVTSPKPLPKVPLLPAPSKVAPQPSPVPATRPLIQPSMLETARRALQPLSSSGPKAALRPPPLTTAKPALLPPPCPQAPPLSPPTGQPRPSNGFHNLLSPPVAEQRAEPAPWLEVGSMVEVNDPPLFGVIRWIGQINNVPEPVAGIELVH